MARRGCGAAGLPAYPCSPFRLAMAAAAHPEVDWAMLRATPGGPLLPPTKL